MRVKVRRDRGVPDRSLPVQRRQALPLGLSFNRYRLSYWLEKTYGSDELAKSKEVFPVCKLNM